MNWNEMEGKWKQMKGSVREKWGKLTDDDLTVINGKRDQLVGRIQERYGIARQEAEKQVDEFNRYLDSQSTVDDAEVRAAERAKKRGAGQQ